MNPDADKPHRPAGERNAARDDSEKSTPAADLQPDDAGTDASAPPDARPRASTPAESAMKQQSKTDAERGR